jgi:hypothetical protein
VPRLPSGFASIRDLTLFLAGLALGAWIVAHPPINEAGLAIAVGLCVTPAATLPGKRGPE